MTMTKTVKKPAQAPPDGEARAAAGEPEAARPQPLSERQADAVAAAGAPGAPPTLEPPRQAAGGEQAVAAWQGGRRFGALFTHASDRNAWAHVTDVGWRRLSPASATGLVALNLLASHAKQLQRPVHYREEADAHVHEMYVW